MFQQIAAFFESIPFFGSVPFALIAMVVVGSSWCLVGLVMGDAPKKGIEPSLVQLGGAAFSLVCSTVIMLVTSAYSTATPLATFLTCLAYFVANVLNFIMLQMMSKAMQCGPNGIIWSIIQCGFIMPFLFGVIFFHNPLTVLRGTGIIALLVALNLMGFLGDIKKGGIKTGGNWKWTTFRAFIWTGLTQTFAIIPSHLNDIEQIGVSWRLLWSSLGFVISAPLFSILSGQAKPLFNIYKTQISIGRAWAYIIGLKAIGLLVCFFIQFPGIDILGKCNLEAIAMPLMVGCCIIGFDVYAFFFLHEKRTLTQLAALLLCLAGTVAICI